MNRGSATRRAVPPLLLAAVFLGFGVTLLGEFVYDDDILILSNPTVKSPAVFMQSVFGSFFANTVNAGHLSFFRPLVMTVNFATWQAFGASPWAFHLTNLLIHLLNGFLALCLVRAWFGLRRGPALVAALVFVAHPIQTEPVAWISGRTDLLCATGVFLALLAAWRWLRRGRSAALVVMVLAHALGLLSKELAVVTPALLLMLAWTRWRVLRRSAPAARRVALGTGVLLAADVVFLTLRAWALRGDPRFDAWPTGDPITTRLTIPRILLHYVRLCIWPHPYTLDHSAWNFGFVTSPAEPSFWASLVVCVVLAALGGALWLRRQSAGAALVWFAVTIAPVSQIAPLVVLAAEYYLYLPVLGFAVLAGLAVQAIPALRRLWPLGLILLGLVLVHDTTRCRHWRDNLTLARHAHRHDPDNPLRVNQLAGILTGLGRPEEALGLLREHPMQGEPDATRLELEAVALINTGETVAGVARLEQAVASRPRQASPYARLAAWRLFSGEVASAEALARLGLALGALDRDSLTVLARVERRRGELQAARETLDTLLAAHPGAPEGLVERASMLLDSGDPEAARSALAEIDPSHGLSFESLGRLAQMAMALDMWGLAGAALEEVLTIAPGSVHALTDLGLVRANQGRRDEARELWQRALALDASAEAARRNLEALR